MKRWIMAGLVAAALASAGVVMNARVGEGPGSPQLVSPTAQAPMEHDRVPGGLGVSTTSRDSLVQGRDESMRASTGSDPDSGPAVSDGEDAYEEKYQGWTHTMLAAAEQELSGKLSEGAEPLLQLKKDLGDYDEIRESSPHTFPPIDYELYHTDTYPPVLQAYTHILPDGKTKVMRIVTVNPKADPALEALAEEIAWLKSRRKDLRKGEGK